jgi:hypothetical protein
MSRVPLTLIPVRIAVLMLCSCLLMISNALAAQPTVLKVTYKPQSLSEYLVIYSDQPLRSKQLFTLDNPHRLVLDVPSLTNRDIAPPSPPADALAQRVRFGHFTPETSRFVVELKHAPKDYTIHRFDASTDQPHRLVLQIKPPSQLSHSANTQPGQRAWR